MPGHAATPSSPQETYPGANYSAEEIRFMNAVDKYKRANRRPYPAWSEVLAVLRSLGYRKVDPAGPLPTPGEVAGVGTVRESH